MPFDQQRADVACNFFERILKHTQDDWYGKPFILSPWQEEALSEIFGQIDADGSRSIEMAYLEVPKKAGKSEMVAGIVLFVLLMDPNPGCQVYGAAAATRQAMNVYRAACKMIEQSPILRKRLRILRGTNRILRRNDPDSFYAAVAADGDLGDGVNPAFFVADEVHRWRTRKQIENWDVLANGGITRRQTLTIAITTAGVQNESPLAWRLHQKTRRILDRVVSDAKFFGRIYGADPGDDPGDPKTWIKANPSLQENGGFLPIAKIQEKYDACVAEGDLTSFKRYFLNLWDQKENRAIPMDDWDACLRPADWKAAGLLPKPPEDAVRPLPNVVLQHFIERKCWVGVDMSMSTDLTAVVFVFPCEDGGFDLLPFFWMPSKDIRKRETRDGVPLRRWAEEGFLELCTDTIPTADGTMNTEPGAVISEADVKARLVWGARLFDVQEFCFDPWNSRTISVPMIADGHKCVEIKQGFAMLSEPSKKILGLVATHKLRHGGHPVLRWNAGCVSASEKNDNLMFDKPERSKNSSRIDGMSATANAMARALVFLDKTSVYERRGLLTL